MRYWLLKSSRSSLSQKRSCFRLLPLGQTEERALIGIVTTGDPKARSQPSPAHCWWVPCPIQHRPPCNRDWLKSWREAGVFPSRAKGYKGVQASAKDALETCG